jgi:hypothetical protein
MRFPSTVLWIKTGRKKKGDVSKHFVRQQFGTSSREEFNADSAASSRAEKRKL